MIKKEINGNIILDDEDSVYFKIRLKSKLLFIETPYQREKLKIIKFFNKIFNNIELESFVPTTEDEIDFICNTAKFSSFKVFIDDEIVRSNSKTNADLCAGLNKNMELIEVILDIPIRNKLSRFTITVTLFNSLIKKRRY